MFQVWKRAFGFWTTKTTRSTKSSGSSKAVRSELLSNIALTKAFQRSPLSLRGLSREMEERPDRCVPAHFVPLINVPNFIFWSVELFALSDALFGQNSTNFFALNTECTDGRNSVQCRVCFTDQMNYFSLICCTLALFSFVMSFQIKRFIPAYNSSSNLR